MPLEISSSLVETTMGNIWVPPLFGFDNIPTVSTIKRPYWTTGDKCKPRCCGPFLTNWEIATYFGTAAAEWAIADYIRYQDIYDVMGYQK